MSKHDKAITRLLSKPTDFSWSELCSLMERFEYEMKVTGGSGRKFVRQGSRSFMVHEPHPQKLLKAYQVRELIAFLKQEGDVA